MEVVGEDSVAFEALIAGQPNIEAAVQAMVFEAVINVTLYYAVLVAEGDKLFFAFLCDLASVSLAAFGHHDRGHLETEEFADVRRTVPEALCPLRGQDAQRRAYHRRGEIRRGAFVAEDEETPVLHYEFETFQPMISTPSDPAIPILQCVASRTQDQHRDGGTTNFDGLPQIVADRKPRPEVMLIGQLLVEPVVLLSGGDPHAQRGFGRRIARRKSGLGCERDRGYGGGKVGRIHPGTTMSADGRNV